MPKSIVPKVIYTPRAYQPYDFMRCFNLTVSDAFGGGSKGPGDGGVFLRGAYDLKPADEEVVRRIGLLRDVGSIEGVADLHLGSNPRSIRGTRCIVFRLARKRWEVVCCQLAKPKDASSPPTK